MEKLLLFLNGIKKELSRVRWPNKKYMFKYSIAVLTLSLFFSLYFYTIDFIIAFIKVTVK